MLYGMLLFPPAVGVSVYVSLVALVIVRLNHFSALVVCEEALVAASQVCRRVGATRSWLKELVLGCLYTCTGEDGMWRNGISRDGIYSSGQGRTRRGGIPLDEAHLSREYCRGWTVPSRTTTYPCRPDPDAVIVTAYLNLALKYMPVCA